MQKLEHTAEQGWQLAKELGTRLAQSGVTAAQVRKMDASALIYHAEATEAEKKQILELPVIPEWMNGKPNEPQQHYGLFLSSVAFNVAAHRQKAKTA